MQKKIKFAREVLSIVVFSIGIFYSHPGWCPGSSGYPISTPTIPVSEAYAIDKKIDDGLPTTGAVQAMYANGSFSVNIKTNSGPVDTTSTCYNTTSNAYSMSTVANYGAGGNCGLSFRFQ